MWIPRWWYRDSIGEGFVNFNGVSFLAVGVKAVFFFTGVLFFGGSMASKFDDADRLTDDERTVFMLRAFHHCHDVDWLVCKRLPTFAILIRYLRGQLEATAENVMTLCDVVDYLRSCKDMSISTSITHVGRNSGAFRADGNACCFEFCPVCNSSPSQYQGMSVCNWRMACSRFDREDPGRRRRWTVVAVSHTPRGKNQCG